MSTRLAFHGDHPVTVTLPAKEWDVVLSALETESIYTLKCMEADGDKGLSSWMAAINQAAEQIESGLAEGSA